MQHLRSAVPFRWLLRIGAPPRGKCSSASHKWPRGSRFRHSESVNPRLSRIAEAIPRSGIRAVMDAAWDLETRLAPGERLIRLEVGQPDFEPPRAVVNATAEAIKSGGGLLKYIPNAGLPQLRAAIVEHHAQVVATQCEKPPSLLADKHVVVTHGAVNAIATTLSAILEPGDELLIPDPGWVNYEMSANLLGGVPVRYPLQATNGWLPSVDSLETLCSQRTKAILLCSPSNPTGAVISQRLMDDIVMFAKERDLFVISDEIYAGIFFGGSRSNAAAPSLLSCRNLDDQRSIVISGVSKLWAMTGFRVGWILSANAHLTSVCSKLLEASISCGVPITQAGAVEALANADSVVQETQKMQMEYRKRRDAAVAVLKKRGLFEYTPDGAFYLLVRVAAKDEADFDCVDFCRELLEHAHVAVSPGSAFGNVARNYVRISLASSTEDIVTGLERICNFIDARSSMEHS